MNRRYTHMNVRPEAFIPTPKTPLKGEEALSLGQRPKNETHIRHTPCKGKSLCKPPREYSFCPYRAHSSSLHILGALPRAESLLPFQGVSSFNLLKELRRLFIPLTRAGSSPTLGEQPHPV